MNNLFQSVRNLYKYLKGSDDVALEEYNERFKELLTPIIAAIVSSPAMLIFLLTCAATVLACWWQFNLNYLYIKTGDQRLSYFITGKPQYDIVTIGICVLLIILGILLVKIRAKKFWERNLVEPAKKEEDKSNPPKVEGEEGINEKKSFEVGKILKRWWEGIASLAGLKGLLYLISFSICLSFLFRCIGFIVELVIQSTNYANRSESFGDCLKCLFPILVSLVTCVGNYLFYFTSLRVKSSKNHKHCRELCAIFNLKREKPAGTFQVLTLIIIVIFAGLGFTSKQPLLLIQDKLSECGV